MALTQPLPGSKYFSRSSRQSVPPMASRKSATYSAHRARKAGVSWAGPGSSSFPSAAREPHRAPQASPLASPPPKPPMSLASSAPRPRPYSSENASRVLSAQLQFLSRLYSTALSFSISVDLRTMRHSLVTLIFGVYSLGVSSSAARPTASAESTSCPSGSRSSATASGSARSLRSEPQI